ncbi:GNAT family N-acetyltransferase [Carbonactinospora thermoautotrophica]|nr:GNAT family N-acetyltransferase [Carbonactinospora thermoautotrophica]
MTALFRNPFRTRVPYRKSDIPWTARRSSPWLREIIEVAVLFLAAGTTHLFASFLGHHTYGPVVLIGLGAAVIAGSVVRAWWVGRHGHAAHHAPHLEARRGAGSARQVEVRPAQPPATESREEDEQVLWRIRTTVQDTPGSLAALCSSLADRAVNILALQVHPLADAVVDEFLVGAPPRVTAGELAAAIGSAGGTGTWISRADAHDLVDIPTRMLTLAVRAAEASELPAVLRGLLGECEIRWMPAPADLPQEGEPDGTTMRLPDAEGGVLVVSRPGLPFTPAEFARAHALAEVAIRLGPREPRWTLMLPNGAEVTIRRAGRQDLAAVTAMHRRCSPETLYRRYLAHKREVSQLDSLLSARFGYTLVANTPDGDVVAMANLMWDGSTAELGVLVEDAWQRQGLGTALVRRLIAFAADADIDTVYAIAQPGNTATIRMMQRLGMPLDRRIDNGTLIITVHVAHAAASSAVPRQP